MVSPTEADRMKVKRLELKGYKSIDHEGQSVEFGDLTVLLGANGSGKSNLVSFFKMLGFMMTGALQTYVGREGVGRLLYYGPKKTETLEFGLELESQGAEDCYEGRLAYGLPDRLFISGEKVSFHDRSQETPQEYFLPAGGSELGLLTDNRATSKVFRKILSGIHTYQFHDTSDTAKIKDRGYVEDAGYLRSDGGNLAAFLRMLKVHYRGHYDRIVRHVRQVMPQFGDFELEPLPGNPKYTRLNWTDSSGGDYLFDPGQISDGSLRFMALATLFLQPPELLPAFIVVDEPELGLHPAAITELAGMVHLAARNAQILLATQSTRLVDEFSPENLVIVERDEKRRSSVFKRLDPTGLQDWLERYSLSELWEKNVLGGQP